MLQKISHILHISVSLFVHFSFSRMKISVTYFSAPIGASVFKFCVHIQVGKVYCVNEKSMLIPILLSSFKYSISLLSLLYNTYGHFSVKYFSATA